MSGIVVLFTFFFLTFALLKIIAHRAALYIIINKEFIALLFVCFVQKEYNAFYTGRPKKK